MIDDRLFAYLGYRWGSVDPRTEEGDGVLGGDNRYIYFYIHV